MGYRLLATKFEDYRLSVLQILLVKWQFIFRHFFRDVFVYKIGIQIFKKLTHIMDY